MRFWAVLCAGALCVSAQAARLGGISPDLLLLMQIRQRMLSSLKQQPDYTCHETIERSRRAGPSHVFEPRDTVQLEVALIGGQEMFAWPGSDGFNESDPREIVADGAIGNGDFALHARAIFEGSAASFVFRGAGRAGLLRYDFQVPRALSRYKLGAHGEDAFVGYHGSVYADPATLDIERIEIKADHIPAALRLSQTVDRMDYGRERIGSGAFLLPAASQLTMTNRDGSASRNRVVFHSCRQFAGHASVSFNSHAVEIVPAAMPKDIDLPSGLRLTMRLLDDIDTGDAAIGDPVRARLENDLKSGDTLLFAKGAIVLGRISRIERLENYTLLGMEFSEIKAQGASARLHAHLERVPGEEFLLPLRHVSAPRGRSGEVILPVRSGPFRLTHGILMFWRTDPDPGLK